MLSGCSTPPSRNGCPIIIISRRLGATKTEADGDEVERPRRFLRIIGEDG